MRVFRCSATNLLRRIISLTPSHNLLKHLLVFVSPSPQTVPQMSRSKAKAKGRIVLTIRSRGSAESTPGESTPASSVPPSADASVNPSTNPSTYPSEDEDVVPNKAKPFRFLQLPSELRNKIYSLVFNDAPDVLDLDPDNFRNVHRAMSLFLVSRQVHDEASHNLYSTHAMRLFPCHPGRFFKTKKPLLARLPPHYRASISSLELRLGPGFANPPRGWIVNDALGLKDCVKVRVLKVMIQIDTSNPIFEGYRRSDDGFYERFSMSLLDEVLASVPSIANVQFDAWSSVMKDGPMMRSLLGVTNKYKKMISWGPERGWNDEKNEDWMESLIAGPPVVKCLPEISLIA